MAKANQVLGLRIDADEDDCYRISDDPVVGELLSKLADRVLEIAPKAEIEIEDDVMSEEGWR